MQRIILILLLTFAIHLPAQIRKELQRLETKFQQGSINEMADRIASIKANNEDERAFISHYSAMLKKDKAEALSQHQRVAERYPKTFYGQKSLLEAAIIHSLDRNFTEAQSMLRKINAPQLPQRMYWLAIAAYGMDDYSSAIANAENYLRLSPEGLHAENAMYLICDAYLMQKKYQSALTSLEKITRIKDYDQQYYLYRKGYIQEQNGHTSDALATYQESYELDRYSQIAFLVEDRIFTMRSHRPSLDISFLYPYSPLEIAAEDSLQSTSPIQSQVVETPPVPVKPIDQEAPIRILTKPQTGIFLQSGRFSVESNAERLSKSIRHLNIPAIYYEEQHQGKKTWVVIAGPFDNKSDSNQARDTLSKNEINSFVVQY